MRSDQVRVFQRGCDIEDSREAHFVSIASSCAVVSSGESLSASIRPGVWILNVAVPEACGDHKACTVEDRGIAGSFDRGRRPNLGNATIVDQDRTLLDRWLGG